MFLISVFYYFCRIATNNCTFRNIFTYHRTCRDNSTVSNINITDYCNSITQPNTIAYCNAFVYISIIVWNCITFIIMVLCNHHTLDSGMKIITNFDISSP